MSHIKALYDGAPVEENSLPNNCNTLTKQRNDAAFHLVIFEFIRVESLITILNPYNQNS